MSRLTNCPVCDKPISTQAQVCPSCGHPMHAAKRDNPTGAIIKTAGWLGGAWIAGGLLKKLLAVIVMIAFFYILFVVAGR